MKPMPSTQLDGYESWAYLRDVLVPLLTHLNRQIDELLPHHW